jgi:hypothetical protein
MKIEDLLKIYKANVDFNTFALLFISKDGSNYLFPDLEGTELEFVIMVIAVSCVKLLSAHNSTQHTSRKHKV